MKSKFLSLIVSVAVVAGLMLVPAVAPPVLADPANDWGFELVPNMTKQVFNADFTMDANANCYEGVADTFGIYVTFNGSLLDVTDVTYPDELPNGYPPNVIKKPVWDNTSGWVRFAYTRAIETPDIDTSFTFATIHFRSLDVEGDTDVNFTSLPDDIVNMTKILPLALNWSRVVNGTVTVGVPKLTVDIVPRPGAPVGFPGPFAAGAAGIVHNISYEKDGKPGLYYDVIVLDPRYVAIPNITDCWEWDEEVLVGAIAAIPGFEYVGWTGDVGPFYGVMPFEFPEGSGNWFYPEIYFANMTHSRSVTANFQPAEPVIAVDPGSVANLSKGFDTPETYTPSNISLTLWNSGGSTLNWSMTDDADYLGHDWLTETPASGSLYTAYTMPTATVTVSADVSGMPAGLYSAYINITEEGDPANFTLVLVNMTITAAEFVPTTRTIMVSGNSGKPGETSELYAGETFDVYVNFTAPPTTDPNNGFNSIGLTDVAPDGWTVTVNKAWNSADGSPIPDSKQVVNAVGNKAEIMLFGPYDEGTQLELMYQVTVPTTAEPGENTWELCPSKTKSWLEYYFNEKGPLSSCIKYGDDNVTVTQPGDIWGETREVNSEPLADVDVTLYRVTDGIALTPFGDGVAEWSTDQSKSGDYSVYLDVGTVGLGNAGKVMVDVDPIAIADFTGVSYWVWEPSGIVHGGKYTTPNFPYGDPYINIFLDTNNDGVADDYLEGIESYTKSYVDEHGSAPLGVTHTGPTPNTWVEMAEGYGFYDGDGSWGSGMTIYNAQNLSEWQAWFAANTTGVTVVAVGVYFGFWADDPVTGVYVDDITISGTTYGLESSRVALRGDSDISTPDYVDTAYVLGDYSVVANRARFYELDTANAAQLPFGADFLVDLTTPANLAAGEEFDFEGDYGLIPRAPDLSYALKCVNLWTIGCAASPEFNLSVWKAMSVCSAWLNPS